MVNFVSVSEQLRSSNNDRMIDSLSLILHRKQIWIPIRLDLVFPTVNREHA